MSLATKLQLRPGQRIAVLRAPEPAVELEGCTIAADGEDADAVLAFVTAAEDIDAAVEQALLAGADADELVWVAYPKAGQLGTDLNRDRLAALLTERGLRPVRQIAIDDVWSALRFRR